MREYKITQEQLETLQHYTRMFELNADLVKDLCNNEKDDVVYGFELGKIYTHLRECFTEMYDLEQEIIKQRIDANI